MILGLGFGRLFPVAVVVVVVVTFVLMLFFLFEELLLLFQVVAFEFADCERLLLLLLLF